MQLHPLSAARVLAAVLATVGCRALPSAHEVLGEPAPAARVEVERPVALADRARSALEAARADARAALAAAGAEGADAPTRAAAAHALVAAAELGLHLALVQFGDALETPDLGAVLASEDDLADDVMRELLGLTKEAAALALEARAGLAGDAALAALHDAAFASTLSAWAMGPQRALMSGAARQLKPLLAENVAAGPERGGAAPLRLQGRFLCRAPWPVGDKARGRALLQQAFDVAPGALNALFLGDAAHAAGDADAALRAWRTATEVGNRAASASAEEDALALIDELVGAQAQQRLDALATARR